MKKIIKLFKMNLQLFAFGHGKNSTFKIDNAATTLTDISAYLSDVKMPRAAKTVDTTTLGASAESSIVGLTSGTISISGLWDATVDAILAGVLGQAATLSFEYAPTGAAGIKYTGECIMTGYDPGGGISGTVNFSASYIITGAVGRA